MIDWLTDWVVKMPLYSWPQKNWQSVLKTVCFPLLIYFFNSRFDWTNSLQPEILLWKTIYEIDPRIDNNGGQSSGHFLSLRCMKNAFRVGSLWVIHFFFRPLWGPSPQFGGKGFIYLVLVVTMTVNTDTWLFKGHSLIYSTAYGALSVCVYKRK